MTSAVDIGPCDSGVALHCPTPDSVISVYPHINLNNAQETETTSLLKKKKIGHQKEVGLFLGFSGKGNIFENWGLRKFSGHVTWAR